MEARRPRPCEADFCALQDCHPDYQERSAARFWARSALARIVVEKRRVDFRTEVAHKLPHPPKKPSTSPRNTFHADSSASNK